MFLLQTRQQFNERRVIFLAILTGRLNRGQHLANRVHHGQQSAGDFGAQRQLAVTQPGEQALARVRQLFQPRETQKSAASLDGMDGPENAGQKFDRGRLALQSDEFLIQPVEVLVAFDKKIFNDFVHGFIHLARRSCCKHEAQHCAPVPLSLRHIGIR